MLGELESSQEALDQITLASDTHANSARIAHGTRLAILRGDISGARAALELGDLEQTEELLVVFEQLAPSERTPLALAEGARFRGRLLALRENREEATEQFGHAIAGFREIRTPYYLAVTLVEQAELGGDDAAPLLAEAREIFERLGATVWLERIDALERAVTV